MSRNGVVGKAVTGEPGAPVGVDLEADRERWTISDAGVVVVPKGATVTADPAR